jgi:hypothetical protein
MLHLSTEKPLESEGKETMYYLTWRRAESRAMRYARGRWEPLIRYLDDGRSEISNSAAERAIRHLAMRRSLCFPSSSILEHWN